MDSNEMVRQLFGIVQDEFSILCELERNDLLFIECVLSGASPEALAAAAVTVRATLLRADALGDRISALVLEARNQ